MLISLRWWVKGVLSSKRLHWMIFVFFLHYIVQVFFKLTDLDNVRVLFLIVFIHRIELLDFMYRVFSVMTAFMIRIALLDSDFRTDARWRPICSGLFIYILTKMISVNGFWLLVFHVLHFVSFQRLLELKLFFLDGLQLHLFFKIRSIQHILLI